MEKHRHVTYVRYRKMWMHDCMKSKAKRRNSVATLKGQKEPADKLSRIKSRIEPSVAGADVLDYLPQMAATPGKCCSDNVHCVVSLSQCASH